MTPALTHTPPRALAYLRVSREDQVDSGLGLAAQRAAVTAEADRRGWDLEIVQEGGLSAKDMRRPVLTSTLLRLDRHEADILLVAKLDRLSRSVSDFGSILDRAAKRGWSVVCQDLGVDTTSPVGELTANIVVSTSQYERRIIGQRTSQALQAKKAAGARLGRPRLLADDIVDRIVAAKEAGTSLGAIARALNADAVPTAQGGAKWHSSTVASVLRSAELDAETAARRA